MKIFAMILIGSFLVSCAAKQKSAETATTATAGKTEKSKVLKAMTCMKGSDTRLLEVTSENGGCELKYTKMGETKSVANSVKGTSHCNSVKDRIIGKLQEASYNCK